MAAMPLPSTDLLALTPQGLYCPPGGFHIDPLRPVPKALITHKVPLEHIADAYRMFSGKLDNCIKPVLVPSEA